MPTIACQECGAKLQTVDEVIRHAETAHPPTNPGAPREYLCPGCPSKFREILQLQRHLAAAHSM